MFKRSNDAKVDQEIAAALSELESIRDDPDKYASVLERITKLDKLKSKRLEPPSLDTVLLVGANIFGVLWLARYEREHVIASKSAFNLMLKPK
jgi:hypothetical protein